MSALPLLYIDTETTGTDPHSARLVELAAILVLPSGQESVIDTLVKPVDFEIPWDAERIHGISTAEAHAKGQPLTAVLDTLSNFAAAAKGGILVAHNLRYDMAVLGSEYKRIEARTYPLNFLQPFCTMTSLTDRIRLPGRYEGSYKWPRLTEAWAYCFQTEPPEGHRALRDCLSARLIYEHGVAQGWWGG